MTIPMKDDRSLRGHPKLMRLARRLEISDMTAIGLLRCVRRWVEEYAPDGDLEEYEEQELVEWLGWEGGSRHLLDALQACGVLGFPFWVDSGMVREA